MKIIIVDDDEIIRQGLKKMISKQNDSFEVVAEVSDGAYGLEIIKNRTDIDLVITDIRMPVMDGLELISEIRKFNQTVKIIVLSGFDDFRYVRHSFKDGAVDYILKPIKRDQLMELLNRTAELIRQEQLEQEQQRLGNQLIRLDIMTRLFQGDPSVTAADCRKLELDFEREYLIVNLQPDNGYQEHLSKEQRENRFRKLESVVADWLGDRAEIILHAEGGVLSAVIFTTDCPAQQLAAQLQDQLNSNGILVTSGVGLPHRGLAEVPAAYREAAEAFAFRFYMGGNHCIEYREISEKSVDFDYSLEEHAAELARCIELFDYVKARRVIEQVFIDLSFMKPARFRKYILELLEMLMLRIKDFERALAVSELDYRSGVLEVNTFNELRSYLLALIKSTISYLQSEKKKRSLKRVELAKQYIEEHYMKALSLNEVADHVELNASYFSNLFKTETGGNFTDYLLNIRIEKAMILLRDPKIKIYEVGSMVGYEDAVSFGRAFKKKVGMSPKEYRNTVY